MKNLLIPAKDYKKLCKAIAKDIVNNRNDNIIQLSNRKWIDTYIHCYIRKHYQEIERDVVKLIPQAQAEWERA